MKKYKLFIITTYNCNLNCKYCYLKKINLLNKKNAFDINNIINSINLLVPKKYRSDSTIIFYGGEPLLDLKNIKKIIIRLKLLGIYNFNIITNGTLINKNTIKKLKNWGIKNITISIDPIETNLKNRSTNIKKLITNAKLIKKGGIQLQISSTISTKINFKKNIINLLKLNPNYIGFNFSNINSIKRITIKDIEYILSLHKKNIKISPFSNYFFNYLDNKLNKNKFCGYYENTTYGIFPDGSYDRCHLLTMYKKYNLKKINNINICLNKNCEIWNYCKGGCKFLEKTNPNQFMEMCKFYKKIVKVYNKQQ
ncbi:MAG: radical SAM protein [Candidatus ainarchaeum sp.]|nr:radical SAM protein [Candidatus ainarchaeum sp.]